MIRYAGEYEATTWTRAIAVPVGVSLAAHVVFALVWWGMPSRSTTGRVGAKAPPDVRLVAMINARAMHAEAPKPAAPASPEAEQKPAPTPAEKTPSEPPKVEPPKVEPPPPEVVEKKVEPPPLPPPLIPPAIKSAPEPEPELLRVRPRKPRETRASRAVRHNAEVPTMLGETPAATGKVDGSSAGAGAARTPAVLTFAGLQVDGPLAASVVYVVDGSGPMVSTWPWVAAEVERSVEELAATQRFNVVLFADRGAAESVRLFANEPLPASTHERARLAGWLATMETTGRSSPLAGLRSALRQKPGVIFLLCRSIARTNGARWDAGNAAILKELDALNPRGIGGERAIVIKVVQFIEPDSTGLLQAISKAHGGGDTVLVTRTGERTERRESLTPRSAAGRPAGPRGLEGTDILDRAETAPSGPKK
ncbi:hypothetical protein BH11PLA1_BH11PLA1_16470 [soil metagenome]